MAICRMSAVSTPRHWGLFGPACAGKSTFLTALRGPLLMIDADHRAQELLVHCEEMLSISERGSDHCDPLAIARIVTRERHALCGQIGTAVVDSLTAILSPYTAAATEENRLGLHKNKASAFIGKANAMRLVQDAVTSLGVDSVYVWHTEDGRDKDGKAIVRQTIPESERKRMVRCLNAVLEVFVDPGSRKRAVRIRWSRSGHGRDAVVLDEQGFWRGVPERVDCLLAGQAIQAAGGASV